MLSRTKSILYVNPGTPDHPDITFDDFDVDECESGASRAISLDRELWAELGHPLVLTVTIEPGDTLNL
jgi:hypothetical protein